MNIFLRDHALQKSGWTGALCAHLAEVNSASHDTDVSTREGESTILFLHTNENDKKTKFNDWVQLRADHHLVIISSYGRVSATEHNPESRIYACYWTPQEWRAKRRREVERLIEGLKVGQIFPKLFRPVPTERLWALRLLCEAYENEQTREHVQKTEEDLPLNWTSVLQEKGGEAPAQVRTAIETDIQELGINVGPDGERSLKSLLDSIEQTGQPPSDTSEVEVARKALVKLLKTAEEAPLSQPAQPA
jgi:hypothetical protein